MYEAELNRLVESIEAVPAEVRNRFAEYKDRIEARTMLPWGEHCTECVWPTCYTTCELYESRTDGGCRLFVDGMVRVDNPKGSSPYLLRLRFKQWGKLWAAGTLRLYPHQKAASRELVNIMTGAVSRNLPVPGLWKPRVLRKVSYLRRTAAESAAPEELPDYFLLEVYNPENDTASITLTVRPLHGTAPPYQSNIVVPAGYSRAQVRVSEIFRCIDPTQAFQIELVPNHSGGAVLYFGVMDFVKERVSAAVESSMEKGAAGKAPALLKCIVWDLDNTLWDGILVEDGAEGVTLRAGVVKLIKQADERGILNSIASKNTHEDAMQALRAHGLDEYFLFPQIKWAPKSGSIAQIAKSLNIGIDSLAFVDDQVFEREEVHASHPEVRTIDALAYRSITELPEWNTQITEESRSRRSMYREQEQRETALATHHGDYLEFLRNCRMEMMLAPLNADSIPRVYELAQRTNQLNFSGNRYVESELLEIAGGRDRETYVISCADRFGDYGIVGFAVVDVTTPRLLDLMFSCRVQGKRVEHAFFTFLLKRFIPAMGQDFYAVYRKTPKNTPSGRVFEDMGFQADPSQDPNSVVFPKASSIPDDGIVTIQMTDQREINAVAVRQSNAWRNE